MIRLYTLLLFSGLISFTALKAQSADTLTLYDIHDEVTILEDLVLGRNHTTELYLRPPERRRLAVTLIHESGEKERITKSENSFIFSYLEEPKAIIVYRETIYELEIELIRVPDPGNEIAWKMVPRITLALRP